jgi:hypothetical protein
MGLPKSLSPIPVARQRPRAPAILRPCVEVLDLSFGMSSPKQFVWPVLPRLFGKGKRPAAFPVICFTFNRRKNHKV